MKNIYLFLLLLLGCINLWGQTPDFSCVGFAAQNGGTTGGKGAASIINVSTEDELRAALTRGKNATEPRIVHVFGKIEHAGGGEAIEVGSDITLFGATEDAMISQINLYVKNASNIIIRNLKFSAVGSTKGSDSDCISIATTSSGKCQNIWIDHCEFFNLTPIRNPSASLKDKYDGLLDIKKTSEYITVSWCYFHDHYKAVLVGYTDTDTYDRKITLHHNRFFQINSRVPSYRGGTGHVYNNYYEGTVDEQGYFGDGVNSREGASLLVENNYFTKMDKTIYCALEDVKAEGYATGTGNLFVECNNEFTANPGTTPFVPSYDYRMDDASVLPDLLKQFSGVGVITSADDTGGGASANKLPVVTILSPVQGAVYEAPADVTVEATATDEDGTIAKVEFFKGTELVCTTTVAPYTFTFAGLPAGAYSFLVKATDNQGDSKSASVNVTVEPPLMEDGGSLFGPTVSADEYFWFNVENADVINALIDKGTIILNPGADDSVSSFKPDKDVTVYTPHIGAVEIAKNGGSSVFKLPGCTQFKIYLTRTGSFTGSVYVSTDGISWTDASAITGNKGVLEMDLSPIAASSKEIYIKVENKATGGMNIHGAVIQLAAQGSPDIIGDDKADCLIVRTNYYTLSGVRISAPEQPGIYIRENILEDGSVLRTKVCNKR